MLFMVACSSDTYCMDSGLDSLVKMEQKKFVRWCNNYLEKSYNRPTRPEEEKELVLAIKKMIEDSQVIHSNVEDKKRYNNAQDQIRNGDD